MINVELKYKLTKGKGNTTELPPSIEGDKLPFELLNKIIRTGLGIFAMKDHGKSDASKIISRQFMHIPPEKLNVRQMWFDPCQNLRHFFDTVPFIEMVDTTFSLPDITTKNLLFDVELADEMDRLCAYGQIVQQDLELKRALKKANSGVIPYWTLFTIEEAQDGLGSGVMKSRIGKFFKTSVAEGRNYNQSFIITGQRLADIDTSVIERVGAMLIGAMHGDNDLKKLKRISNEIVVQQCQQLTQGQWILWTGNKKETYRIDFPRFVQEGKPYPLEQKKGLFNIRRLYIP